MKHREKAIRDPSQKKWLNPECKVETDSHFPKFIPHFCPSLTIVQNKTLNERVYLNSDGGIEVFLGDRSVITGLLRHFG